MSTTMRLTGRPRWGPLYAGGALMGVLATLGATMPAASRQAAEAGLVSRGPVCRIVLPDAAPVVPEGPNRALFQANCRLCHSPRLVLTQPRLTEKQWGAVVKKMVNSYGALIAPEQERDIVAYLMEVRGRAP